MTNTTHSPSAPSLTHLNAKGEVHMVDVGHKPSTARSATTRGLLRCTPATRDAIMNGAVQKGEALAAARIAGIMAAKQTGTLIPLCHPLALHQVTVDFSATSDGIAIEATARCTGPTGVEMEAMVATSVAGLTLYDMAKAIERDMVLDAVRLVDKRGGKSGHWQRPGEP